MSNEIISSDVLSEIIHVISEEIKGEEVTREEVELILKNFLGEDAEILSEEEKEVIFRELLKHARIEGEGFSINNMIGNLQKDFPLLSKEEEREILKSFYSLREKAREFLAENPSPVINFLLNSSSKEIKEAFIDKEFTLKDILVRRHEWIEELEKRMWPEELNLRSVYLIKFLKELGEKEISEELERLREKMILSNVRLVASVVGKYGTASYDDLFQEGIFGLEKAIDKFNPYEKENKFATYATWWIRQAVSRAFNEINRTVKCSKETLLNVVSIDAPLNDDGFTIEKTMSATIDIEEEVERKIMRESVAKSLSILNRIERRIIEMKYYKGMKPSEIAEVLGTKPTYVSQIEREALKKLRSILIDYQEN